MGMIIRWHISTRTSKHPQRDGGNGQDRNVFLAEHVSLIISKSAIAGEFGVIGDMLLFMSNGSQDRRPLILGITTLETQELASQEDGPLWFANERTLCAEVAWCFSNPFGRLSWFWRRWVACFLGPLGMLDILGKCLRSWREVKHWLAYQPKAVSVVLLGGGRETSQRDKKRKPYIFLFFKRNLIAQ